MTFDFDYSRHMQKQYTIAQLKKSVMPVARRFGLKKVAVFGSAARGEMKKRSDIDLLLDVPPGTTLLDLVAMRSDFRERFGHPVDVVTYDALHPLMRDEVLQEQKILYAKKNAWDART